MKPHFLRTTTLAAATLAGLGLGSCKDYLDVDADAYYTPEQQFSTVSAATSAVIGVYDNLSGDQTYGTRVSMYFPYDTDEFIGSSGTYDSGRRGIARYKAFPTNSEITNPWNTLYQGVDRANTCIYYLPRMAQFNSPVASDSAAVRRLYGEALTLRAQFMYELVRNWGDVPNPRMASSIAGDQNQTLTNNDRNQTLDSLIVDLARAEKLVPWRSNAGTNNERITKGAVKALRARIALARGGYYVSSQDGSTQRASDYLTYYNIARRECGELMAQRTQHTLNASYNELWRSINELRREAANEIMFEVGMGGSTALSDSKLGYYNGPRMTSSPLYGTTQGAVTAVPTYFYAFDSTDVRRDITFAPYLYANNSNNQTATTLASIYDGKFRRDWRNPLLNGSSNYLGYSWPIIRFADVLLMFAEADNEVNGPTTAARNALLEVRTRGFGGNATRAAAGLDLSSKASFFNALVNERFLEFGGEGIRKYDLLRWNLLNAKLTEVKANLALLRDARAPYANVPQYMYYRVVNGQIQWTRSFYRPSPANTTAPSGQSRVNWRQAIDAAYVNNTRPDVNGSGVAAEYKPNLGKELLPIPQTTIDTSPNRRIKQNFGY